MQSVKKNARFRQIYAKGESKANQYLVLYKMKNEMSESRLGITVSAKVGKAHVRNKIKRRIKEIIRLRQDKILSGYDLIFIARVKAANIDYSKLEASVNHLLKNLDLYYSSEDANE